MSCQRKKPEHDAAGRPTRSGSRQQKHDNQGVQSGNPEIDKKDTGSRPAREAKRSYRNRPAKHR